MKHNESKLSEQVAEYLKLHKIIYRFDAGADIKLTMPQAIRMKKLQMSQRGYPDLFLAEPIGKYHGLYIELKKDRSEVFKLNGEYKKKRIAIKRGSKVIGWYDHIQEQLKCQQMLRDKGYCVVFGFGLKDTIEKIAKYTQGKEI